MEASTAFRKSAVSKTVVAVIAGLLAAMLLGGVGGYLVRTWTLPVVVPAQHAAAASSAAPEAGSAWDYSSRRHGTQSVDGPEAQGSRASSGFREPGSRSGGPQA
jgi:hypothetical protein